MDRRTILAIALSALIFILWQKFYIEPRMPKNPSAQTVQTPASEAQTQSAAMVKAETAQKIQPKEKPQPIEAQSSQGKLWVDGGVDFITDWESPRYKVATSGSLKDAEKVSLKRLLGQGGSIRLAFEQNGGFDYLTDAYGSLTENEKEIIWRYEDEKIKLIRTFKKDSTLPYIDATLSGEFKEKRAKYLFVGITQNPPGEAYADQSRDWHLAYWTNNSLTKLDLNSDLKRQLVTTPIHWISALTHYFTLTVLNNGPTAPTAVVNPTPTGGGELSLIYPLQGSSFEIPLRLYFGPKQLEVLKKVDPTLENVVDYGWFTFIAFPLFWLLKWTNGFVQNFGIAIILVTLLLRVLTLPLTIKSMKSMKRMAKLQPQIQRLRERFKDDPQRLNQEMLSFMKKNQYNPVSGCLPLLIQMPIFIGFFNVLRNSVELYQTPFALWIHDLSLKDPYYVTPAILVATMFLQQKLSPQPVTDPAQAKMMQFMPLIFGAMMITMPSGLGIYMLTSTIAGIIQQVILNKKFANYEVSSVPA